MTSSVLIDNIDIRNAYNAIIVKAGDEQLLRLPSRVDPEYSSYFEYSGIEVDLQEKVLRANDVEVMFALRGDDSGDLLKRLDLFYRMLSSSGYRKMYIRALDRQFELRYLSTKNYKQRGQFSLSGIKTIELAVQFAIDNPYQLINEQFEVPTPRLRRSYVVLNGIDLADYGITVSDVYSTALLLPAKKQALSIVSEHESIVYADVLSDTSFEPFDIIISCAMRCDSVEEYYNNISALFAAACQDQLVKLSLPAIKKELSCYYSRQDNVVKIHAFDPNVHLRFDLIFKSIDYQVLYYLLQSEQQQVMLTEDSKLIMLS